jgi:hypothetical protein
MLMKFCFLGKHQQILDVEVHQELVALQRPYHLDELLVSHPIVVDHLFEAILGQIFKYLMEQRKSFFC